MTPADVIAWHDHVVAMIEKCQAHQDEFFYHTTLPGWERELRSIEGGDDLAPKTTDDVQPTLAQKEHHT